jgi:hypothetical protein
MAFPPLAGDRNDRSPSDGPIQEATGTPLAQDRLGEGGVTPTELMIQIAALGAIVREALTRDLTPEEESAVADLVECLREFLDDDDEF